MFLLFSHVVNFHHPLHLPKEVPILMHDRLPQTSVGDRLLVDDALQLQYIIDLIETLIHTGLVLHPDLHHADTDHDLAPTHPDLVRRQEEEELADIV